MTTPQGRAFSRRLVLEFSRRAFTLGRPSVRRASRTLARSLKVLPVEQSQGGRVFKAGIFVPHYWAVFVHDGRGRVNPTPPRTFLVFFFDPRRDPRNRGGRTPIREEDVRRLTPREFSQVRKDIRIAKRTKRTPPALIVKSVNPTRPKPFFDNEGGLRGFILAYPSLGEERFRSFVRRYLRNVVRFGQIEKRPPIVDLVLRF